ncbi:MAG TPA: toll/interleukin-1 receptor domain-containing protein [Thermoanaerobaculia bacterium]|nr:toll/interleukin-1 receptor domain-containing protein [Thermoanaerobaculia bacterium]
MTATTPTVFLCHASEDMDLARRIAEALQSAGIETFFDKWSISTGESIRQRIDEGLSGCTHFVVLLTKCSIDKPWVNAEIDAGFVRRVQGQCKFLPVRSNLDVDRLPPLLQPLYAPELKSCDQDIRALVDDIYGISRKPPLGMRPSHTLPLVIPPTGLSIAAESIASEIVRRSGLGRSGDPKIEVGELMADTGLSAQDFEIAIDELEGRRLVEPIRAIGCPPFGYRAVMATKYTFVELDQFFMGWDPFQDAVRLAVELMNSGGSWLSSLGASSRLGWTPRQMNPALTYLIREQVVFDANRDPTFVTNGISKNNRTLRFVREHS